MLFNSFIYPFFLAGCVALYWLAPVRFRMLLLIFFSIIFYSLSGLWYLLLITGLAVFVYWIAQIIRKSNEEKVVSHIVIGGIAVILMVLVWFKYSGLLVSGFAIIFSKDWKFSIALPLGISFFTFEFIHYLIELHRRQLPEHRAIHFFAFALFFPTLVSGPVKRFQVFFESLKTIDRFQRDFFFSGLLYILFGYAEKYLLADSFVLHTAFIMEPATAPSGQALLSGIFFYSFRIYFDFLGLSNIAIGSALLFGIKVPINFNHPYLKPDIAQFWRSWHMSLTNWIRDYIYMPLVFRFRNSKLITFGAVILIMALIGLWHGSSLNFLFFGLYHGVGLALLQIIRSFKIRPILPKRLSYCLGVLTTFVFVTLGWPFFVTSSLHDSLLLYQRIFAIFV